MPARYRVGCAGMFMLGTDFGMNDRDEAIVACEEWGPPGCEVYDTVAREWIGPGCKEDVDYARARLAIREDLAFCSETNS